MSFWDNFSIKFWVINNINFQDSRLHIVCVELLPKILAGRRSLPSAVLKTCILLSSLTAVKFDNLQSPYQQMEQTSHPEGYIPPSQRKVGNSNKSIYWKSHVRLKILLDKDPVTESKQTNKTPRARNIALKKKVRAKSASNATVYLKQVLVYCF